MEITDVRIRKIEQTEGKLRGVASITIDEAFVVHDIKVIQGDRGLFIAMPSRKTSEGDYRDIAHPITSPARDKIQKAILEAYEKAE
ncbi:MAG: septation regulator SpoVG [Lachnospiraceae bacterium]|nr:septation regulator SpoVG [Lachnospiraceae bacterium]